MTTKNTVPTVERMRQALLDAIAATGPDRVPGRVLQPQCVIQNAVTALELGRNSEQIQVLQTMFYDFFRNGMLTWGSDIDQCNPPHCHVTEHGRKMLAAMSRDPMNPEGYMAHVKKCANLNLIAESYLSEALSAFNAGLVKATAVMVGGAAESVALELRDTLRDKLTTLNLAPPKDLNDWRIKKVSDSMQRELAKRVCRMPQKLKEDFESCWTPFVHQIRTVRNDSGHPGSIDSVTFESVHASLLIFPMHAKLACELKEWIDAGLQ